MSARVPSYSALYVSPRIVIKCIAWNDLPVPADAGFGRSIVCTRVRPIDVIPIPLGAKNTRLTMRQLTSIKLDCARQIYPDFTASHAHNGRPLQRSPADEKALRRNIVQMVR